MGSIEAFPLLLIKIFKSIYHKIMAQNLCKLGLINISTP